MTDKSVIVMAFIFFIVLVPLGVYVDHLMGWG